MVRLERRARRWSFFGPSCADGGGQVVVTEPRHPPFFKRVRRICTTAHSGLSVLSMYRLWWEYSGSLEIERIVIKRPVYFLKGRAIRSLTPYWSPLRLVTLDLAPFVTDLHHECDPIPRGSLQRVLVESERCLILHAPKGRQLLWRRVKSSEDPC